MILVLGWVLLTVCLPVPPRYSVRLFFQLFTYKEGFGFAFCGGRQRRTRRLILVGSYLEHIAQNDPEREARLMKGLDGFLERDRDRELFGLPPRPGSAGAGSARLRTPNRRGELPASHPRSYHLLADSGRSIVF